MHAINWRTPKKKCTFHQPTENKPNTFFFGVLQEKIFLFNVHKSAHFINQQKTNKTKNRPSLNRTKEAQGEKGGKQTPLNTDTVKNSIFPIETTIWRTFDTVKNRLLKTDTF